MRKKKVQQNYDNQTKYQNRPKFHYPIYNLIEVQ